LSCGGCSYGSEVFADLNMFFVWSLTRFKCVAHNMYGRSGMPIYIYIYHIYIVYILYLRCSQVRGHVFVHRLQQITI
jgi:hypothetical protein